MLRKGQIVAFTRPMSSMRRVLDAIEVGNSRQQEIREYTGMRQGQVASALYNLTYVGAIVLVKDDTGRSCYLLPGGRGEVAKCLKGVSSIFNVR
jgi:hypothetical protein